MKLTGRYDTRAEHGQPLPCPATSQGTPHLHLRTMSGNLGMDEPPAQGLPLELCIIMPPGKAQCSMLCIYTPPPRCHELCSDLLLSMPAKAICHIETAMINMAGDLQQQICTGTGTCREFQRGGNSFYAEETGCTIRQGCWRYE